jgi:hypothetical protein
MDESRREALAEIRSKLELLKQVEAEHGFGVTIEAPGELKPIPELPEGVIDVFGMFRRLDGSYFVFEQPAAIESRRAWADRHIDPYCPMGNPLGIGWERYGIPRGAIEDFDAGGTPIYLDVEDGVIYCLDGDDYVFLYKHPDEEMEIPDLAPDIVTFFNFHVLGAGYPQLIEAAIGPGAVTSRDRRGRHRDNWMRLLTESGLL